MTENNKRFVAIDTDIIKDTENGGLYTNDYVADWLDVLITENEQLKQEYQKLKHRHSLLHDECFDAEHERDSLKKDVESLEKENEQLKKALERKQRRIDAYEDYIKTLKEDGVLDD